MDHEPQLKGACLVPPPTIAVEVVREFWRLMASNDFHSVAAVLAEEFVLEWPQSKERIRGLILRSTGRVGTRLRPNRASARPAG